MISTLVDMMAEDEDYYRASHLAGERLENETEDRSDYDLKRPTLREMGHKVWRKSREEGLLKGEIDGEALLEVMINNQQSAMRDWAHQMISLEELHRQTLRGFYITLAADAENTFREKITAWLEEL